MFSASPVAVVDCVRDFLDVETLRTFVRRRRDELGLSQTALASKAGVEAHAVWMIETGRSKRPKTRTLQGLAAALNEPVETLAKMIAAEAETSEASTATATLDPATASRVSMRVQAVVEELRKLTPDELREVLSVVQPEPALDLTQLDETKPAGAKGTGRKRKTIVHIDEGDERATS